MVTADIDAQNAATSRAELVRAFYDGLDTCACYVSETHARVTTWTGDLLGYVTRRGRWHAHVSGHGVRWRAITVRDLRGRCYSGREYNTQNLCRLRRRKKG